MHISGKKFYHCHLYRFYYAALTVSLVPKCLFLVGNGVLASAELYRVYTMKQT